MRVLGVDPGSRATGFGVVDFGGPQPVRIAGGVIHTKGDSLSERLACIHRRLLEVFEETQPRQVAIESVFSARTPRSALLLGHARGAALAVCGLQGMTASEYAPTVVKGAVTGYGAADKRQVQHMVQRLLRLPKAPPEDEADALAVALCHGQRMPPPRRARPRAAVTP